jgi:hypothetical protein
MGHIERDYKQSYDAAIEHEKINMANELSYLRSCIDVLCQTAIPFMTREIYGFEWSDDYFKMFKSVDFLLRLERFIRSESIERIQELYKEQQEATQS